MKITLLAFVLLFALSTKPLHGGAAAAAAAPPKANASAHANAASLQQVVDTSGKKLRAGVNYYIVPAPFWENSGGLALTSIGDQDCPLEVVSVDGYQGLPLRFEPVNYKKGVVRVDTDLNIIFSTETSCPESTVWKLDDYDVATGQYFVTTGGVVGNPGWQTINNWFKIENYGGYYKLTYCPSVCPYCSYQCRDIGIYEDQYGNKRLALSYAPYAVQFQQA